MQHARDLSTEAGRPSQDNKALGDPAHDLAERRQHPERIVKRGSGSSVSATKHCRWSEGKVHKTGPRRSGSTPNAAPTSSATSRGPAAPLPDARTGTTPAAHSSAGRR